MTNPKIRALQATLALTGSLFIALTLPMFLYIRQEPALAMMLCVYATLGIFLFFAIPHPQHHRSLIQFTAWSSLAHAVLMSTQALKGMVQRGELIGCAVLFLIFVFLFALTPHSKQETIQTCPTPTS